MSVLKKCGFSKPKKNLEKLFVVSPRPILLICPLWNFLRLQYDLSISSIIIHQIFLLTRDWPKRVT